MIIVHSNKTISRNQLPAFHPVPLFPLFLFFIYEHNSVCIVFSSLSLKQRGTPLLLERLPKRVLFLQNNLSSGFIHPSLSIVYLLVWGVFLELAPIRHALRDNATARRQLIKVNAVLISHYLVHRKADHHPCLSVRKGESIKGEKGRGAKRRKKKRGPYVFVFV
jgi:hypothetical protein